MENKKMMITIDGSSWTGKSSAAKALAKMLNYQYLNTGWMFRSVAFFVKRLNIENVDEIAKIASSMTFSFKEIDNVQRMFVNGEDITDEIVLNDIIPLTAKISLIPNVRESLLKAQRELCKNGGFVAEGRDMGSIVFPDADWKFFLNASLEVKIERFIKMLPNEEKKKYSNDEIREIILATDKSDRERKIAPLIQVNDAIVYDNSASPSGDHDATVFWYYINNNKEIIGNSTNLEGKSE